MWCRPPAVLETVRKGNRLGLVYERVDGRTLLEKVQTEPEKMEQWGRLLTSLTCPCTGPMSRLVCRIKSSGWHAKWTPAAFCHVKSVPLFWKCWLLFPQDAPFATATFIPGNIIIAHERPSIIDWVDATVGNPIADVARTVVVLLGHIESGSIDENEKIGVTLLHRTYLHHYMATVPDRWHEYEQWLIVAAATRLAEGIAAEQPWLLRTVRSGLARRQ